LIRNGDVVLVEGREQGLVSASIAVGARLRYGQGSPHARYSHVALVYDVPAQDPDSILVVEATAASGVQRAFLTKYWKRCKIVHARVDEHDWRQVREFLDDVVDARTGYGMLTYLGLTLYALTGSRLCLQTAGTATCSGLVCDALTRAGFIWDRPPYACTPADIDVHLEHFDAFEPCRAPTCDQSVVSNAA
jgi:hypothetical protein